MSSESVKGEAPVSQMSHMSPKHISSTEMICSPGRPYDAREEARKLEQDFEQILSAPSLDLGGLRALSWKGIPSAHRAMAWKIIIGYVPTSRARREETMKKKRAEYQEIVSQHFDLSRILQDPIYKQISIDIPRTCPSVALFKEPAVRESLTKILYCWSIRRPASGYVQGINDLVTPFYDVFLSEHVCETPLSCEVLAIVEADCFWCFSKLVDSIQDNYTPSQAGIFRQIGRMKELLTRTEPKLMEHFAKEGLELVQFAFRWMNCMLLREFPLHMIIRIWDTYLAEGDGGFSDFHTYVCTAFLSKWTHQLLQKDFSDMLLMLQDPPTQQWSLGELEVLLSEAFVWKSLFHN